MKKCAIVAAAGRNGALLVLAAIPIVLLLVLLVSDDARQRAGYALCFCLWGLCVSVSALIGLFGGLWLSTVLFPDRHSELIGAPLLAMPFMIPTAAVLAFLGLYQGIGLRVVAKAEKDWEATLAKPRIRSGVICSAVSPFILIVFLSMVGK